jgi:polyisoprenyl-teichoic acid--peptidoglycan teichoic acid transferase
MGNVAPATAGQPVPASSVNPSLTGVLGPLQPLQPVFAPVPVERPQPQFISNPAPTPAATSPADNFRIAPQLAPAPPVLGNEFTMPSLQAVHEQAVNMSEAAAHIDLQDDSTPAAGYLHDKPSPFDIATIQEEDKPRNRLSAGRAWRKWMMHGGIAVLVLLVATGGYLFYQGFGSAHKVFRGTTVKSTSDAQTLLKGESTGHVNILLLGNGGNGHEAPDLTDTLMVESIDTVNHTATLLSIPRDLWVQVPKYGSMKINAAYEVGKYNKLGKIDNSNADTEAVMAGFATADQAVETVTGLDINYNLLVNFTSFKQAVDAVGGVDVNVPEQLYDPTMAWENGGNPVLAAAGEQQMNGTQALRYVRSRETSSDFARGARQRAILLALKSKVLSAGTLSNPLKLSSLLSAFGDNMVSDLSLSDAMRAYSIGKGIDDSKIKSVDLVTQPNVLVTTSSITNVSIDVPKAGMFNYADIKAFVQSMINPQPASTTTTSSTKPENATIAVFNGTTKAGLASSAATTLKAAGYTVGSVGNAPGQSYPKTVIVDLSGGANPNTKAYLEKTYSATVVTTLPDSSIQAGSAQFVVILGSDQAL